MSSMSKANYVGNTQRAFYERPFEHALRYNNSAIRKYIDPCECDSFTQQRLPCLLK